MPPVLISAYSSVFPSSYLPILPLTHSFTHPSIQVSAHLSTHPSFHLTIYQFALPSANNLTSIHPSTYLSIYSTFIHCLSIHLFIHPHTPPSICPSNTTWVIQDLFGINCVPWTITEISKSFIPFLSGFLSCDDKYIAKSISLLAIRLRFESELCLCDLRQFHAML